MRLYPVIKKVLAAAGLPTFTAPDTVQLGDSPKTTTQFPDAVQLSDTPAVTPKLSDTLQMSDLVSVPSAAVVVPDTLRTSDRGRFTTQEVAQSRSGTPDSDAWGDSWTDATIGQTNVNHGAEATLSVASLPAAEHRGLIKTDLRRYAGLTALTGGSHSFEFRVTNTNLALQATLTLHFGNRGNTNPFTESAITQANQPATVDTITAKTTTVPANTTQAKVIPLTDADVNALIGGWLQIVVNCDLVTSDAQVVSREGTAADRPQLNLQLQTS